jgi:hypothetical protein
VLSNPSRVSSKGLISALWTTTISGDAVHTMPDIARKIITSGAINPLLKDWLITCGIILFSQIARHETADAPAY